MKLVLDTHTFIWMDSDPARVPQTVLAYLADPACTVYLSVTSIWEIMIKGGGGKPSGPLADDITKTFGDFAAFQAQLKQGAVSRFGSGSIEAIVWHLAKGLVDRGHEVTVFGAGGSTPPPPADLVATMPDTYGAGGAPEAVIAGHGRAVLAAACCQRPSK